MLKAAGFASAVRWDEIDRPPAVQNRRSALQASGPVSRLPI